ncbi:MAG: entericidin A/B family lipoprotein [Rhodospirillales bacterium]|nr:entericidin A/B family lipoprotein [Rhodospirillales bacterium]
MRKSFATAFLSLFVLSSAAALLSACNTMEGLGRDTSAAGRAVTNSASDTKQKL